MLVVWLLYDVICIIICILCYVKNGTFHQTGYVSLLFGINSTLCDYYKVYGWFGLIFCVGPKMYILIKGVPPNSVNFLLLWCGGAMIIVSIFVFIVILCNEDIRTDACLMSIGVLLIVLTPLLSGILMFTSSLLNEQCTDQCSHPFMNSTSAVYLFCVLLSMCGPLFFAIGKDEGMYQIGFSMIQHTCHAHHFMLFKIGYHFFLF